MLFNGLNKFQSPPVIDMSTLTLKQRQSINRFSLFTNALFLCGLGKSLIAKPTLLRANIFIISYVAQYYFTKNNQNNQNNFMLKGSLNISRNKI